MNIELDLRCPSCRNTMKYQARGKIIRNKRKVCVYCGRSFLVEKNHIRIQAR